MLSIRKVTALLVALAWGTGAHDPIASAIAPGECSRKLSREVRQVLVQVGKHRIGGAGRHWMNFQVAIAIVVVLECMCACGSPEFFLKII